jgi:hypothetical protein
MEKGLQKAFNNAKYHPEATLADTVWSTIVAREQRSSRLKMWMYALVGALSLVSLFPVIHSFAAQSTSSGFSEYLSLIFSDSSSIALYWKEFALTLADSLPTTSLILSLSLVGVFLVCVKRTAQYVRNPSTSMKYI